MDNGALARELQRDLARKYRLHASKIEPLWRSFDKAQRTRCLRAGAADGAVLKHSMDLSMGNVYKIVPEWNQRDITESGSDFLLDLFKHRATKNVSEQYMAGVNGGPGDHAFIGQMMRERNLRHVNPFKNCYTMFLADDDQYGKSFKLLGNQSEVNKHLAAFAPAIRAGLCVPQSYGELILQRQLTLLQCLNIIIEDILEEGSTSRNQNKRAKKSDKAAVAALSALKIQESPSSSQQMQAPQVKLTFTDLVATVHDQKASLDEYLGLLATEPVVLAHAVNIWFFSRPELVSDEKGRMLPVHTDVYISAAFFDAVHTAVKAAAIWNYLDRLLGMLEDAAADKVSRAVVLQEISNICHLEYARAQALFKRHIQTGTGAKWFKRLSNAQDNTGNARVNMKGNPAELTRADAQLHYVLRLCQSETNASKAVDWIKKLSELHQSYPTEREKLQEREYEALGDLAVIIGFIQDLSPVISIPSLSRKKGQVFVSKLQDLETELNQLKKGIDLRGFAVPIDNLLEPGVAEAALKEMDQFVIEKAGAKMGFLYEDLIGDCLSELQNQCQQAKADAEQKGKTEWVPLPVSPPQPTEKRVEERRQKEKTRPLHSSAYEIIIHKDTPADETPSPPQQLFKVSASTVQVFSTLFTKSRSRGSVPWAAFVAAMADLGFSVLPKYGSVYAFTPPDTMAVDKSLSLHRPHCSRIEGHIILVFAQRLKRVYGWSEQTFEVA